MKTTLVSYSKVFALPNFQNEKICIEVQVDDEDPVKVIEALKSFVEM
jgi:hypothetical protein